MGVISDFKCFKLDLLSIYSYRYSEFPTGIMCFQHSCKFSYTWPFVLFFSGVYFTSIDPSNDPKKILLNNYDDAGQVVNSKKLWAKIDWVIKIKMEDYENEFEKVSGVSNRDVYLYEGDVHLNNYQYRIYKNPNS